ncbi:MAG: hypothetical protein HUJ83_08955 [Veillonella sp.]|nr:hypothetical protein [Veillonella sp.]
MLKFSTTTPFSIGESPEKLKDVRPLIMPSPECKLQDGALKGRDAYIVGEALVLAGFCLPCFFDGDITELDQPDPDIMMVLPTGEYPITCALTEEGIYLLDIKYD